MKFWILGTAGILAVAACEPIPTRNVMIDCGATDVLMTGETANAIKMKTGDAQFGTTVCSVIKAIDASTFVQPTPVKATLPSGDSYNVQLRISQQ